MKNCFFEQKIGVAFKLILLIVIGTLLSCCNGSEPVPDFKYEYITNISGDIHCLWENKNVGEPLVIRSGSELEEVQHCFKNETLFVYQSQTLVAIRLRGGGCDFPEFEIWDLKENELAQTVTIVIRVDENGNCALLHETLQWIAIESLPQGYSVFVEYDYH